MPAARARQSAVGSFWILLNPFRIDYPITVTPPRLLPTLILGGDRGVIHILLLLPSYPSNDSRHTMDSLNPHPHSTHQLPKNDVENQGELKATGINRASKIDGKTSPDGTPSTHLLIGKLARWNAKVEGLAGLEARGITRVLPEEKHDGVRQGYLQMFALWFSMNLVVPNVTTGLLGPLVFELGWVDCVCIVIFAIAIAACGPAYISTFGPESGNRTMVRVQAQCMRQIR